MFGMFQKRISFVVSLWAWLIPCGRVCYRWINLVITASWCVKDIAQSFENAEYLRAARRINALQFFSRQSLDTHSMATPDEAAAASNNVVECSICLSPLSQPGMDVFTTSCQHAFHFQCLAKNVQAQNNECPLCRKHLDSLVQLINGLPAVSTTVPSQNVPVQQLPSTPTPSTPTNDGLWATLTGSLSRLFSGRQYSIAQPGSQSNQARPDSSRTVSRE